MSRYARPADQVFVMTYGELEALAGLGPLSFALYVYLRSEMDYETGLVGRPSMISLSGLRKAMETVTNKGRGCVRSEPSEQELKTAVARLVGAGLVLRVPGEYVVFSLVRAVTGSVRANQTQRVPNGSLSTVPNGRKASAGKGLQGVANGNDDGWVRPNPTHISGRCLNPPSQSSSTDLTGVDAAGVNRDRAAPSQAGQLTQPGKTGKASDRDRPSASHPAPGRRLGGGAERGDTDLDGLPGDTVVGSAEGRSTGLIEAHRGTGRAQAMRDVLMRRGVSVSRGDERVAAWEGLGVSDEELDAAVSRGIALRAESGADDQKVNVGYVDSILRTMRAELRRREVKVKRGAQTDRDIEAIARELGMWPARLGESMVVFKARVLAAAQARVEGGRG